MVDIPVVLIIFNRPDLVRLQIESLRKIAPRQLCVVADGPRPNTDDKSKCDEARKIIEEIDWDCSIVKEYADTNLGCGKRVATGLDKVFSIFGRAIILEDDCFASPVFFDFCEELLHKYEKDEAVMQICGTNLLYDGASAYSYRFSHHVVCWGWATWARAWKANDLAMGLSQEKIHSILNRYLKDSDAVLLWESLIARVRTGVLNTWDYPWQLSVWRESGISIFPNVNLVSNKGFGEDSTHTKNADSSLANLQLENIAFPLLHPDSIAVDEIADNKFVHEIILSPGQNIRKKSLFRKIASKIKSKFLF